MASTNSLFRAPAYIYTSAGERLEVLDEPRRKRWESQHIVQIHDIQSSSPPPKKKRKKKKKEAKFAPVKPEPQIFAKTIVRTPSSPEPTDITSPKSNKRLEDGVRRG